MGIHNHLDSNLGLLILNGWHAHISMTECNMSHFAIKLITKIVRLFRTVNISTIGQIVDVHEYFHIHFTHYQYVVIQIHINTFIKSGSYYPIYYIIIDKGSLPITRLFDGVI